MGNQIQTQEEKEKAITAKKKKKQIPAWGKACIFVLICVAIIGMVLWVMGDKNDSLFRSVNKVSFSCAGQAEKNNHTDK